MTPSLPLFQCDRHLQNLWGKSLPDMNMYVYERGPGGEKTSTKALDIYTDETGSTRASQPLKSDSEGNFNVWAERNRAYWTYCPGDAVRPWEEWNTPPQVVAYKGTWNASTNSPTLADGTGVPNTLYRVSTAGTRDLGSGSQAFAVGDYVFHEDGVWTRVSSSLGLGSAATAATSDFDAAGTSAGYLPWLVSNACPWLGATAMTGTVSGPIALATGTVTAPSVYNGSNAQNDEYGWDVILGAGTWTISLTHYKGSTYGIASVRLDGTTVGSVDCYNASTTWYNPASITGVSVASSGKKRLSIKIASKNASSSGYYAAIQAFALRRTA